MPSVSSNQSKASFSTKTKWVFLCLLCTFPYLQGSSCSALQNPNAPVRGKTAKVLYERGIAQLKASNFPTARKYFRRIITKHQYEISYVRLSELRIADSFFMAQKYLRAIDAYKIFARVYPTHPKTAYALYQTAKSYDKLQPWDVFILPPSYEKDSTHTCEAVDAFCKFLAYAKVAKKRLRKLPKNLPTMEKKAHKRLLFCVGQMARHELNIAKFYEKHKKYKGMRWRLEFLLKHYPGTDIDAEARYMLGDALQRLKHSQKAYEAFQILLKRYPKSSYAARAKKDIEALKTKKVKKVLLPGNQLTPQKWHDKICKTDWEKECNLKSSKFR